MDELKKINDEANKIADWLNNNPDHPRFNEGFDKMRELMNQCASIYLIIKSPKQGELNL